MKKTPSVSRNCRGLWNKFTNLLGGISTSFLCQWMRRRRKERSLEDNKLRTHKRWIFGHPHPLSSGGRLIDFESQYHRQRVPLTLVVDFVRGHFSHNNLSCTHSFRRSDLYSAV